MEKYKTPYKNNKFKILARHGMKSLKLHYGSYFVLDI